MIEIKCTKAEQNRLMEIFYTAREEDICLLADSPLFACLKMKNVSSCDACILQSVKWGIVEAQGAKVKEDAE